MLELKEREVSLSEDGRARKDGCRMRRMHRQRTIKRAEALRQISGEYERTIKGTLLRHLPSAAFVSSARAFILFCASLFVDFDDLSCFFLRLGLLRWVGLLAIWCYKA